MSKPAFGVRFEGGPSDAFTRERASATPLRQAATRSTPRVAHAIREAPAITGLRSLQEWTASAIIDPSPPDGVEHVVLPSSRMTSAERLEIYRFAYRARLVECLADDYPVLQRALGEASFESICHSYIDRHPSRSPNLNFFGQHMASFCRETGATFSADLATLEWAMVEVLHASPAKSLSLEELGSIAPHAWASARFAASDTVRVFEFAYPVGAYLQAVRMDEEPALPAPGWSATAVFRDGATIWRMDLSRAMHALLQSLFQGHSLGAAFDELAEHDLITEDQAPEVMGWFRDWVGHGIFGAISIAG
jgi:hypothetical protein